MRHLAFAILSTLAAACTPGFDENQNGQEACAGPLGKPISISNINAMSACCQAEGGKGHCLEDSKVPAEVKPFVSACDSGGSCIPDSFLETGAAVPPKTCVAFGGDGVCLSKCIPQVAENAGLLRNEGCEENPDDLCVPCINPLDQTETGACQLLTLMRCEGEGPNVDPTGGGCDDPSTCNYDAACAPVLDPSTLPECGADAHCVDAALAGEQAAQLGKCADGVKVCVPDAFIKTGGKFTAATCKSVAGAEGRCLNVVIPQVAEQAALLPQDTCAASEKCTPCFDPLDGTPTGACSLSCDTGPTTQAAPLPSCCGTAGKCVPTASIPDDQEGQLAEDSCEDDAPGSLCVPNEIIANGPFPPCTGEGLFGGDYTGVCLSDCLDFGFAGIAIEQGSCANNYTCAPCESPLTGEPTGAPGCPAAP